MSSRILAALYRGNEPEAQALGSVSTLTLPEAAALGLADACRALIAAGALVDAPAADGWPPLHLAAFFGRSSAVRVLLEYSATVGLRADSSQGNTALHACLAGTFDEDVFAALLEEGSDVNAPDAQAVRPVHLAAARGNVGALERLRERGAALDSRLSDGKDAMALAHERGHMGAAEWLQRALGAGGTPQ